MRSERSGTWKNPEKKKKILRVKVDGVGGARDSEREKERERLQHPLKTNQSGDNEPSHVSEPTAAAVRSQPDGGVFTTRGSFISSRVTLNPGLANTAPPAGWFRVPGSAGAAPLLLRGRLDGEVCS